MMKVVVKTEIGDYTTQPLDHSRLLTGKERFCGPLHTRTARWTVQVSGCCWQCSWRTSNTGVYRWIGQMRQGVLFAVQRDAGHSGTLGWGGGGGETAGTGRETAKANLFSCCSATKNPIIYFTG